MLISKIIRPALVNPRVLIPALVIVIAYAAAVVIFTEDFPKYHLAETKESLQISSLAIGLIYAFRMNTAYDRWWEGRKLWGQLVNEVRNFSIKFPLFFQPQQENRQEFARLLAAFPFALKCHLRDQRFDLTQLQLNAAPQEIIHIPLYLTKQIYQLLNEPTSSQTKEDSLKRLLVDPHAKALMDICGACERIKYSPISGWFTACIWIWLVAYLIWLPWLVAAQLDIWTVPLMAFASYFGISFELLAEEIEEPFGCRANDLPTDLICKKIAMSLEQTFEMKLTPTDCADCRP